MIESDIYRAETNNEHHGTHHGASDPDVHSGGIDAPITDSTHEADEHIHHEQESEPTERKSTMKNQTPPTLAALALAVISIITLAPSNDLDDAAIRAIGATAGISADIRALDDIELCDIESIITKEDIDEIINIEISNQITTADDIRIIADAGRIGLTAADGIDDILIEDLTNIGITA